MLFETPVKYKLKTSKDKTNYKLTKKVNKNHTVEDHVAKGLISCLLWD